MKLFKNFIALKYFLLFFFSALATCSAMGFQAADTLQNYFQLDTYTGTADTVFISHPRYHGHFKRDTCTTEDYGTTILTNTGCWQRIHSNFSPRYWAIGGPAPDFLIGPTVTSETDAINSAAYAASLVGGDTIEIDSLYLIDRSINLFTNNTYLGTCDNCGFKRINPPITILTDTAKVNDSRIQVASNTGFKKRHKINIARSVDYDSLSGFVSYTASINSLLGGDTTIFLSGRSIQKQMLPGDSVGLFFPMMVARTTPIDSIRLERLIFDGNRRKYTLNYDWRVSPTLLIPTTSSTHITHCHFKDIPNENIFLCGAVFENCTGTNLNGSVLHFSCSDPDRTTRVLYNQFSNTNEAGNGVMFHSEAGLTFSAQVQNLRVAYNRFENVAEHGIGIFRNDDQFNEITDNLFDAALATVEFQPFYLHAETNLIYNNKNINFADTTSGNCWHHSPGITVPFACQGASSEAEPLVVGDTITISLDSLAWKNSNGNFVKAILPEYSDLYFTLADMKLTVARLSQFHHWNFTDFSPSEKGLIFDNGHRDGRDAPGNWGYEPCDTIGNCIQLDLTFVVRELPDSTVQVDCPLSRIRIIYDGEMGTWETPVLCDNLPIPLDTLDLGRPFLLGDPTVNTAHPAARPDLKIFPNPCQDYFRINFPSNSSSSYQILTPFGHIVQEGILENNLVLVKNLPKGLFRLKILTRNKLYFINFTKI